MLFSTIIAALTPLGVGLASCIIPLYIGELSPSQLRGKMVTINVLAITFGQCVAYGIGAVFQHVSHGWRYMVSLRWVVSQILLMYKAELIPALSRRRFSLHVWHSSRVSFVLLNPRQGLTSHRVASDTVEKGKLRRSLPRVG